MFSTTLAWFELAYYDIPSRVVWSPFTMCFTVNCDPHVISKRQRWSDDFPKVAGRKWIRRAENQAQWCLPGEAYVQQRTNCRALFFLVFFIMASIEVFLPRNPPFGNVFWPKPTPPKTDEHYYFVFMGYIIMIVTECFLTMFVIYLGMGLYYDSPGRIEQYLICRFCTWLAELVFLVILCLTHHALIGWYLVFLMIVILEFYAFIVVYSYYVDMVYDANKDEQRLSTDPSCCPC